MFRRGILGVVIAALATMVATPAQAAEWCLHDPALVFSAPHAKHTRLTVYATEGVQGAEHEWALQKAHLDFTAKPGKVPGTVNLTVHANVRGRDHESFATVLVVSSGPFGAGRIYGLAMASSGRDMRVTFDFLYDGGG